MNRSNIRVAVGLSGGVDSAVSAYLLKKQGYEVVGVHLYCWPPESEFRSQNSEVSDEEKEKLRAEWIKKNGCRADEDKQAALKTALELAIPFQTLDFSEEYNRRVVNYFYREYEAGRTPNPDVLCNSEIKFGLFLDWALKNNFDYIATGHYAKLTPSLSDIPLSQTDSLSSPADDNYLHTRLENPASSGNLAFRDCVSSFQGNTGSRVFLYIPKDKYKDQTYFLWKLTQKELKHVLFPLGDLTKPEVRKIAQEAALPAGRQGLSVAKRKDSQGICFVGNVDAREFLSRRLKEKIGEVRNTKGEVIGSHKGVWFYTIGQRGGWKMDPHFQKLENSKLKKIKTDSKGDITPIYYVLSKDAKKNELVVGIGKETEREEFEVGEVNWINPRTQELKNSRTQNLLVRIRHGGKLMNGKLTMPCLPAGRYNGQLKVELSEGERGVAPGQSAVFYSKDGEMLGGGVIA